MLRRRLLAAVTALGLSTLGASMAGGGGTPAAAETGSPPPVTGRSGLPVPVTLVTGDRFLVSTRADGRPVATALPDAAGKLPDFSVRYDGDDLYVLPRDVERLVPDVLDPALFDVTELVSMGYDDRSRPDLPVIVKAAPGARTLDAPAGLRPGHRLESIGAETATIEKSATGELGTALARTQTSGRVSARSAATTLGGLGRIWLDRKVGAASLDANLTQINAPAAWDSGLSGKDVTVAVLDSGIDSGHPDLAGRVRTAENFTDDPDASDGDGHGTHVASLLAGSGAAAGGARRGVAFGATLLSGKVLDSTGAGQESWVIEGMQWAVDQGSRVISMSLSGPPAPDDPVAAAVDSLSASTGTLFVVAAGNSGSGRGTIQSPGTAAAALTVGAVDADNQTAFFSSRGPTAGDYRLKPEITAPGVSIIGARAGARGSDLYTTMSGTSQATPQVAGAAALLLQQHPDWTGQQVKNRLVATAHPNKDLFSYDQGGGRLDLAHATTESLSADVPGVDLGYLRYPDRAARTRQVTLSNPTGSAVTLDLRSSLTEVVDGPSTFADPGEMLTVTPARLTVPAKGTATATVTLDPRAGTPATYSGQLSIMDGDRTALQLPIGFYLEPERYDVSVTVKDRHGDPYAGGTVSLYSGEDFNLKSRYNLPLDEHGKATVRVEPGWYAVLSRIETLDPEGNTESIAFAGTAEVHVDHDLSVGIDARSAKPIRAPVLARTATKVDHVDVFVSRADDQGGGFTDSILWTPEAIAEGRVLVQPTSPVKHGTFAFTTYWRLSPTGGHSEADDYNLLFERPVFPARPAFRLGESDIAKLARLDVTYHGRGAKGTTLEARVGYTRLTPIGLTSYHEVAVPSRRIELVTPGADQTWDQSVFTTGARPVLLFSRVTSFTPGQRLTVHWFRTLQPELLDASRAPTSQLIAAGISDGEHVGQLDRDAMIDPVLRLVRNQQQVGRESGDFAYFTVPDGRARFGAEQQIGYDTTQAPLPTAGHTFWTFTSTPSTDPDKIASEPPIVSLNYLPALSLLGTATSGQPLRLDVQVRHLAGSAPAPGPARSARLWFSTDGGHSWQSLHVDRVGAQRFRAVIPGPELAAGTSVSVRAAAVDAGDQRIDQTVIGMFPVR